MPITFKFPQQSTQSMSPGSGIGSAIQSLIMAPVVQKQAEMDAANLASKIYSQSSTADLNAEKARGERYTNDNRIKIEEIISQDPTMPEYRKQTLRYFGLAGPGNLNDYAGANEKFQKIGNVDIGMKSPEYIPTIAGAVAAAEGKPIYEKVSEDQSLVNPYAGARPIQGMLHGKQQANIKGEPIQSGLRAQSQYATGNKIQGVNVRGQAPNQKPLKLTDTQDKAQSLGTRMAEADAILTNAYANPKYSPATVNAKNYVERMPAVGGAIGSLSNLAIDPINQKVEQAQRNFINAVLRRESGAVISDDEFKNAQLQYFPDVGDSPELLAQKAANRKSAIEGMAIGAGKAGYRVMDAMNKHRAPTGVDQKLWDTMPDEDKALWN